MKMRLGLALAGAVMLAGCTGPIDARRGPGGEYPQITLESYYLQQHVQVQNVDAHRFGAGQLEVGITLYNQTDADLVLDYRASFLDLRGGQVEPPQGWISVRLPRKGSEEIKVRSATAMAQDFRVLIRQAE